MNLQTLSLRQSAIRGGMFTFGAQAVAFLLQITSISVLAQLIRPENYGMIGILSSVLVLLQIFRDLGLTIAIVQAPSIASLSSSCLSGTGWYTGNTGNCSHRHWLRQA